MATTLETPSRIWRRIEAIEHRDMPSLPSLPPFEDSEEVDDDSQAQDGDNVELIDHDGNVPSPMHSTAQHTTTTYRGSGGNNSSAARFADSIASISSKSSNGLMRRRSQSESIDIPSLLDTRPEVASDSDDEGIESKSSVPEAYLPPDEDEHQTSVPDFSLADALESVSREESPLIHGITEDTPKKNYDYSVSLRSEPKVHASSSVVCFNNLVLFSLHLWRSIVMLHSARPTQEPGRHLSLVHPLPNRRLLAILLPRAIVLLHYLNHRAILLYNLLKFSLNRHYLHHTTIWRTIPCKIPISAIQPRRPALWISLMCMFLPPASKVTLMGQLRLRSPRNRVSITNRSRHSLQKVVPHLMASTVKQLRLTRAMKASPLHLHLRQPFLASELVSTSPPLQLTSFPPQCLDHEVEGTGAKPHDKKLFLLHPIIDPLSCCLSSTRQLVRV